MLKKLNQLFHILSSDPRILPLHFLKKSTSIIPIYEDNYRLLDNIFHNLDTPRVSLDQKIIYPMLPGAFGPQQA